MFLLLILIILFPNVTYNAVLDIFRTKTIKIDHLEGKCPQHPNAVVTFDNLVMIKVKRLYTISSKITIKDDVKDDLKLQIMATRCTNRDAPDTCEEYPTLNIKKLCSLVNGANHSFTPFLEHTHPRIQCPLRKGIYRVVNGTFDGNALSRFPIDDWYWKVRSLTREMMSKKVVMCSYLEGQIVPL
ncbi:hypothetical protein QE152_g4660 [Popillia japonica]|uniref:Uncharacterized protein n=1 Tax=Popillia japonica TaxID=7064 RepID=A0AAW1N050_POPJA